MCHSSNQDDCANAARCRNLGSKIENLVEELETLSRMHLQLLADHELLKDTTDERQSKLEAFIWNNYIEPECEYKHSVDLKFTCDHDLNGGPKHECSVGLAPYCDQSACPIFRTKC